MNFPERIQAWNRAYDALPEDWRFQAVLWPLILLGAINMGLTVAVGFPFGLLVMLALIGLVVVRVPYVLGWVEPASVAGEAVTPRISVSAVPWVYDLNLWYDGLPETRRPWVILVVLVVAGGLNMLLTIHNGFSFGILFLLALLAILLIRAPYAAGWLIPPTAPQARIATAAPHGQITQEAAVHAAPMTIVPPEPAPVAMEAAPAPPVVHEEPSPRLDDKPA